MNQKPFLWFSIFDFSLIKKRSLGDKKRGQVLPFPFEVHK